MSNKFIMLCPPILIRERKMNQAAHSGPGLGQTEVRSQELNPVFYAGARNLVHLSSKVLREQETAARIWS